jgi:hypothetical protein
MKHEVPHTTIFYEAGKPKPPDLAEAERAATLAGAAVKSDDVMPRPA